jgi:hypothetical protein
MLCQKVGFAFWPHTQHEQHRRFLTALKRYVLASSNLHKSLRWKQGNWPSKSHAEQNCSGFLLFHPIIFMGLNTRRRIPKHAPSNNLSRKWLPEFAADPCNSAHDGRLKKKITTT